MSQTPVANTGGAARWWGWALAGWMLICTGAYVYTMTADRLAGIVVGSSAVKLAGAAAEEVGGD